MSKKISSIIVTGATSMIGSAIVAEALEQNKKVAAVVRKNSPQICNLTNLKNNHHLEMIECALEDYASLKFNSEYDAFIHTAWKNTNVDSRDNVHSQIDNIRYTIDAVHAAESAGCDVFIDAGSQAEYGRVADSQRLSGNTPCNPESGYGIAKFTAGKMAFLETAKFGLRFCHTRILSVYGEGMSDQSLIMGLIKSLQANGKPSLTKCEQIWDYMYVRDTARAFLAIAEKGVNGKTYPIGSGTAKPLREYVEIIRGIINPAAELGFGEKDYYPHQPMILCADTAELFKDTGFKPLVNFEDGIKIMMNCMKKDL